MSALESKIDSTASPEIHHFHHCVTELVKATEAMTSKAIDSKEPANIKAALIELLESNRTLIAALDQAYKKLHEARMNMHKSY